MGGDVNHRRNKSRLSKWWCNWMGGDVNHHKNKSRLKNKMFSIKWILQVKNPLWCGKNHQVISLMWCTWWWGHLQMISYDAFTSWIFTPICKIIISFIVPRNPKKRTRTVCKRVIFLAKRTVFYFLNILFTVGKYFLRYNF